MLGPVFDALGKGVVQVRKAGPLQDAVAPLGQRGLPGFMGFFTSPNGYQQLAPALHPLQQDPSAAPAACNQPVDSSASAR